MWPETNNPRQRPTGPSRPTRVPARVLPPEPRASLATPHEPIPSASPVKSPAEKPERKTVEINISLPKLPSLSSLKKISSRFPRIPRKYLITCCLAILIGVIVWFAGSYLLKQRTIVTNGGIESTEITASKITDRPDYPTVLPTDKNIDSLGGWTRVSPAEKNPVFAYADKISGTPISVSQQPLPKEFKQDTADTVERFAKSYQATVRVTAGNTVAYIGTSAKGPQSVIFTKNDLLILIKSSAKIDTAQWGEYISSLK